MPKLPRALSSAESNAGAPIRPDGGVFCTDFQSCLQRRSLSALQVDNDCGTHSAAQGSQVCHCEARSALGSPSGRAGSPNGLTERVSSVEWYQLPFIHPHPLSSAPAHPQKCRASSGRSAFSLPRCPEKFETVQKMLYTFRENCVILLVFGAGGQTRPSAGGGQIPHKQERKCRRFSEDKAIQG